MEKSRKLDFLAEKDADILVGHKAVNARLARSKFSRLINTARMEKEVVVITDYGEPAAAIIPISDLRFLDRLKDMKWINKIAKAEFSTMSPSELKALVLDADDPGGIPKERAGKKDVGAKKTTRKRGGAR